MSLGALLGTYDDTRFKTKQKGSKLTTVELLSLPAAEASVASAKAIAAGVILTKQVG